MYIYQHIRAYTYASAHTYPYVPTHMSVYTSIHTHTYEHKHMNIHICTHMYTYKKSTHSFINLQTGYEKLTKQLNVDAKCSR